MTRAVTTVVIVVPVHDEAELLDRCLRSLRAAVAHAEGRGLRCVVRVVLDACTDGSELIAVGHGFPVIAISAGKVGEARARGVEDAMIDAADAPLQGVWIASTDADSAVPENWIVEQCDRAEDGADVFIGTVRPDFADLSRRHRTHWIRSHLGHANGHVHGASLGVRADFYAAAGGFAPVAEHEDVDLVERCRLLGATLHASREAEVLTSGRFVGRTPGGYAGYLRDQAAGIDRPQISGERAEDSSLAYG